MTTRFLVSYDISDDQRRGRVFKVLRSFGDHVQYSVFRCDLTERKRIELTAALHGEIDHSEDQILVVDLGPVDGRAATCVIAIGRRYMPPERTVVIV